MNRRVKLELVASGAYVGSGQIRQIWLANMFENGKYVTSATDYTASSTCARLRPKSFRRWLIDSGFPADLDPASLIGRAVTVRRGRKFGG